MRAKIEGEDAVRALYYERPDDFTRLFRPGGLTEDPARGVSACELNQARDHDENSAERRRRGGLRRVFEKRRREERDV